MRFGIMAMQIGVLAPRNLGPEELEDYAATFDHAALIGALHREGFNLIELGGDLGLFFPHAFAPSNIEALATLKAAQGLTYTVHLPLWSVEPSTPLRPVREGSVQAVIDVIEATRSLAPEVYVLHATGALAAEFYRIKLPEPGHTVILRQFQQAAMQSVQRILTETGIPGRQLALETIEFPFDMTLGMAEALDVSICLDVGHVLSGFSGPISVLEALDQSADRLVEVHLHDAVRPPSPDRPVYGKDHRPLGTGDLDLAALLDRLVQVGFGGPIIFELTVEEAQASLEVVRAVRPDLVGGVGEGAR